MHLANIVAIFALTISTANAVPTTPSSTPCDCSSSSVPSSTVPSSSPPSITPIPTPTPKPTTGNAIVQNNCADPIYLWSLGHDPAPQNAIAPGKAFSQAYWHDPVDGGVAIKITSVQDGLYNGSPQLVLAYTLNKDERLVYYDLSTLFGSPFKGKEIRLNAGEGDKTNQVVEWKNGVPTSGNGSPTMVVVETDDLMLTIC